MIYLIKNLSTTYTIVSSSLNNLPIDDTYSININNGTFNIKGKVFADVIHMPNDMPNSLTMEQNLSSTVDMVYESNREQILLQNKNKFVIALIRYIPDYTKDVLYANFYINIIKDSKQRNLLESSLGYYYDIYNYKTNKFERFIDLDEAIQTLDVYTNQFVIDYKSNLVKQFSNGSDLRIYIESQ